MDYNEWNNKKILILGGAGFIGSNLAEEFINLGAQVKIVDGFVQHTGANRDNIKSFVEKIDLYDCRVENLHNLSELVNDSDFIIDSIGLTAHIFGIENPLIDVQYNLICHLLIISALKGSKNKKVIYLGSRGQYGNIEGTVISEKTPQNPIDAQGINKVAAEIFYKIYAQKYGFKVVSLRITNCFGQNQKCYGNDIGLVGSFIRDMLSGKTVDIFGKKERRKNLIYIKDLVKIITRFNTRIVNSFEAYNIAGYELTIGNILDYIIGIIGRGKYVVKPFPKDIKNIDVGEAGFSDEKIRYLLGRLEFTNIRDALSNTIEYFKRQRRNNNDLEM